MDNFSRQILDAPLTLSASDRAFLAAQLIDSLDPDVDDDNEAAWGKEIARRSAAHESGTTATIPWEDVRARIVGKQ
ncbi:MAG: addiction module protein [Pirellulales bacterium]|nr:addiction module protein [Pirellulales bacterium]